MKPIKALGVPKIKALGLNNTGGIDKSQQKSLSIIYKSCSKDDKFIYLYFDVYAKALNSNKAQVYVDELDGYLNDTAVPKTEVIISQNSGVGITLKFGKNKNFTESFYDDGNVFQATITCDGLSAKTLTFKLVFKKNMINKKDEVVKKEYATQADWDKAAKDLGINDPDLIKAMAYKETFMNPFFGDYPSTMYERHRFYELYKIKYGDQKAEELYQKIPDLVNPDGGGYHESDFYRKDGTLDTEAYNNYKFGKVKKMMSVDNDIAIMSASYGTLQVLGEYCNYSNKTPTEFLNEVSKSEKFQIRAFVNFIKGDPAKKDVPKALNAHNWEEVAKLYNGKYWYRYNKDYPGKLKKYYEEKPWKTNS